MSKVVNGVLSIFLCIQRKNEEAEKKIELFMMGKVPDTNGTLNLYVIMTVYSTTASVRK